MNLALLRFATGQHSTEGALYVDERFACFTLEDQYQEVKVPGETRIPAGIYELKLRTEGQKHRDYSKRFGVMHKGMLWLQDVPGFTYIYIHCGNDDLQTLGCILVGDQLNENVTGRGFLGQSTSAYTRIYGQIANAILAGEPTHIEIVDYA